jgi:glyoxylase-like metal-dependent hydrolase (beta-lactamase superfamily II)
MSELVYPFADAPAAAQPFEVAPGVHWLRLPLPFALDHINLWLLEDGDGYVLVDTGVALPEVMDLWQDLLTQWLAQRPLRRLIVTHYHPDHVGLAGWLAERCGLPLAMTAGEYDTAAATLAESAASFTERVASFYAIHGLDENAQTSLRRHGHHYLRLVCPLPERYERLAAGDELSIGGRRWQVIIGEGHTPEHACLYCPSLDVLIAGDQVLPRISTNISVHAQAPEADPLALYLASLTALERLPASVRVLPSHGLVFSGLHARIEQLKAHHRDRLAELVAACRQPQTAAELLPVLFRRELNPHTLFFAMGEAIAHLNYLAGRGELERQTGADGVHRFVAA